MVSFRPHFLLFSRAEVSGPSPGRWHFLLESVDGDAVVEATDAEPGLRKERLELLAVIRGLEALDQPSRVTLVTPSTRISRGFRFGLEEWRSNRWRWERDGRWVPIKNRDLWQRVDRALQFHRVECRTWRFDPPQAAAGPVGQRNIPGESTTGRRSRGNWPGWRKRLGEVARPLFEWPSQMGHWSAAS